jgi:hypothetical protein
MNRCLLRHVTVQRYARICPCGPVAQELVTGNIVIPGWVGGSGGDSPPPHPQMRASFCPSPAFSLSCGSFLLSYLISPGRAQRPCERDCGATGRTALDARCRAGGAGSMQPCRPRCLCRGHSVAVFFRFCVCQGGCLQIISLLLWPPLPTPLTLAQLQRLAQSCALLVQPAATRHDCSLPQPSPVHSAPTVSSPFRQPGPDAPVSPQALLRPAVVTLHRVAACTAVSPHRSPTSIPVRNGGGGGGNAATSNPDCQYQDQSATQRGENAAHTRRTRQHPRHQRPAAHRV